MAQQGQDTSMLGLSRIRVPAGMQRMIHRRQGEEEIERSDQGGEGPSGDRERLSGAELQSVCSKTRKDRWRKGNPWNRRIPYDCH
jgi:hypothetical protein